MFCNKIHEMIPHQIQYEIQKFQFLGYEFKQKLAKSSTQAYKNDWEIIFITTFFKKMSAMEDMLASWKLFSLNLNKICPVFSFQINILTLQFLWVNKKNNPTWHFTDTKKKLGSSKSHNTCYINNKPSEFCLLAHTVNNVCGYEVFKLYLNVSKFFYLF